jgi:hypothetical protein
VALALVVGLVGVVALLLYLMNSLDDDKHLILKLILLFASMSFLLLIPKAGIDSQEECYPVISSEDTVGAITSYNYTTYCTTTNSSTGLSFLENTQRLYWIFIGYAVVFLAVWAMIKLYDSVKQRGMR